MDMTKPIPLTQPWSTAFWEGTKNGKLLIQHCKNCDSNIFYPRKFCPECWSENLDWIEATGKATIYSYSTAYDMVEPRFWEDLPYTLAYVDLDEGVRMATRIIGSPPEEIFIGKKVVVTFHKLNDDFYLPYFKPA